VRVRREFYVRGRSIKEICRELHVSRNTVRKILRSGETAFALAAKIARTTLAIIAKPGALYERRDPDA
jgi:DNA-binding NarL/FixJ family response regulator